jgi:hypothetical protein
MSDEKKSSDDPEDDPEGFWISVVVFVVIWCYFFL